MWYFNQRVYDSDNAIKEMLQMKKLKISMLGAGSGFVLSIAKELLNDPIFADAEFMLMDPAADRLEASKAAVAEVLAKAVHKINLKATTDRTEAVAGADYIITSCEKNRYANWVNDLRIPEKHDACQVKGENGGPGGLIHGLRNICLYKDIVEDMEKYAPGAWLMNFTNPMSILCTYFKNYSTVNALGFCHQVHGSFGLIAEQLGMEPGELEVVTGGVNHFNWLFDIRKRNTRSSCMEEFLDGISKSKYWHENFPNIPKQKFSLELMKIFGMYPVGYDDHVIEYLSCFYEPHEWQQFGYKSLAEYYENLAAKKSHTLEVQRLLGKTYTKPPFPVDPDHPYYAENPCKVISALETNTPTYFDAINIVNHGAIGNIPSDVILDVPGIAIGGQVRSIYVGELPPGPRELIRRQTALHELIAQAAYEGSDELVIQALCLDPYVRSITQARAIWEDFRKIYKEDLTTFR